MYVDDNFFVWAKFVFFFQRAKRQGIKFPRQPGHRPTHCRVAKKVATQKPAPGFTTPGLVA